jgi:tetratricopeptide (TPR) repeat protein
MTVTVGSDPTPDPLFPGLGGTFPLAGGRLKRALDSGNDELLSDAIANCRRVLDATSPEDRRSRSQTLGTLGVALAYRFKRHGAMADIDEAIEVGQRAADLAEYGQLEQLTILVNLAVALRLRFDREGPLLGRRDLDTAVTTLRRAAAPLRAGSPRAARIAFSLCTSLRARYEHYREPGDLSESIKIGRELVATAPAGEPIRARAQVCLGLALVAKHRIDSQMEELEEAASVLRQALAMLPPDHEDRPVAAACLAQALSGAGGGRPGGGRPGGARRGVGG